MGTEYFEVKSLDYECISLLDMWVTGGGSNHAQWSNPDYDALIKKIKSSSDQTERMALMHQAEDLIFADWMLCPLYYYVDIYLQSTKLEGTWASFYMTCSDFEK